jgi:hypothetical protein
MTIPVNKMAVLGCVLLLASVPGATAQSQPDSSPKIVGYQSGQV